jgi:hypothetical protein
MGREIESRQGIEWYLKNTLFFFVYFPSLFRTGCPDWANFHLFFGRIFYFRSSPKVLAHVFHGKNSGFILTKNGLDNITGDFLPNRSGHPASAEPQRLPINSYVIYNVVGTIMYAT